MDKFRNLSIYNIFYININILSQYNEFHKEFPLTHSPRLCLNRG